MNPELDEWGRQLIEAVAAKVTQLTNGGGAKFHVVNNSPAAITGAPGLNIIRVRTALEAQITVTSVGDCYYIPVRESGTGPITITPA